MPGGPVATGGGIGGEGAPKSKIFGILMVAFAAFGGVLFGTRFASFAFNANPSPSATDSQITGYDTGVISGVKEMRPWLCSFGDKRADGTCYLPSGTESLVVSILSLGTFFGALAGAPVADNIGRKFGVVFACGVFAVGVVLQLATENRAAFIVGRVVAGLGVGLVSTLIPMYQSEW
jgi:MFS transporter, SP family, sugar:H+ symporter